uniref:hypothetical protein n=1 Tax=Bacillus sp. S1-R4H1-FB TaxID=1973492 RepID=UPI00159459F5
NKFFKKLPDLITFMLNNCKWEGKRKRGSERGGKGGKKREGKRKEERGKKGKKEERGKGRKREGERREGH